MSLSFEHKGKIFDYLGNPERWDNVFDDAFYSDPIRKYRTQIHDGIKISYPPNEPDNGHFILTHLETGAFLEFVETSDGFTVTDERGVAVNSDTPYLEPAKNGLPKPANINADGIIARIKHLEISVSFSTNGDKSITFTNQNGYISLNGPDEKHKEELRNGRLLHRIIIDQKAFENLTGSARNSLTLLQLVVARDLSLQENLRAFNGLATNDEEGMAQLEKLYQEVRSQSGARKYRDLFFGTHQGRYALMEKAWDDTTEFVGHISEIPSNFSVQKFDEALHLFTSLNGREKILSYSRIFQTVAKNLPDTISLSELKPEKFVATLLKGIKVQDHRDDFWRFVVINHGGDFSIPNSLKENISDTLQIDSNEFAVINFHPKLSIVAARSKTLEAIKDKKPFYKPEAQKPIRRVGIIDPALVV